MDHTAEEYLIEYFLRNRRLTRAQRARFIALDARRGDNQAIPSYIREKRLDDFNKERLAYNPRVTADFLSLFGAPSGLKFLTHDFDPESGMEMKDLLKQVNSILKEWKDKVPESIFKLISGMVSGQRWLDYNSQEIRFNLSSLKDWCRQNPGLHPIVTQEYGESIQSFRDTVRISKPRLEAIVDDVVTRHKRLSSLRLIKEGLQKADFYTNVMIMKIIIEKALLDISQREQEATVEISYTREISGRYRRCGIRITHKGSEANPFEDVRNKLMAGGGALSAIMKHCRGYCDWAIEAKFEDTCRCWRILESSGLPEIKDIPETQVTGFTHIFTFYHKMN